VSVISAAVAIPTKIHRPRYDSFTTTGGNLRSPALSCTDTSQCSAGWLPCTNTSHLLEKPE
jgi:hypothetical protein